MDGIGAAGANEIGGLYKDEIVDPITHKALHAALGALEGAMLNGKDGAKAGMIAATIVETLGDLVRPQSEDVFETLAAQSPSKEDFDTRIEAYLLQQKNLLLLTTSGIMAGLGQDVDTAIVVADNAIENNAAQLLKAVVEGVKIAAKAAGNLGKGAWKKLATKKPNAVEIGDKFGKLGEVVKKPAVEIKKVTEHYVQQKVQRSVPSKIVKETLKKPEIVLKQSNGSHLFISENAAVVLDKTGKLVTTYGKNLFNENIKNILRMTK